MKASHAEIYENHGKTTIFHVTFSILSDDA